MFFGTDAVSEEINASIFNAVEKYIKQRFSVTTHLKHFPEGRINLTREVIGPRGVNWVQLILPNAFSWGSVPVFLGNLMQLVIFQEVSVIPPPQPLYPSMNMILNVRTRTHGKSLFKVSGPGT